MPVATVIAEPKRFDLKSLPSGFVVIRRMNYGEKLQRTEMNMKMRMDMADRKNMGADLEMMTQKVTQWSFAKLIVDHNLEDVQGRKLNFRNPNDVALLDGVIGEEIDTYIDKVNNFDDEEALGNSNGGSSQASSDLDPQILKSSSH